MTAPRYPDVVVPLIGGNGNAFAVLARCRTAARRAGVPEYQINMFVKEATGGDYDQLLRAVMAWFTIGYLEDGNGRT